jgi:hypothetical protein
MSGLRRPLPLFCFFLLFHLLLLLLLLLIPPSFLPPSIRVPLLTLLPSSFSILPSPHSKRLLHILSTCYPERLFKCFLVDAPMLFQGLWAIIKPFLDPVTKAKGKFIPPVYPLLHWCSLDPYTHFHLLLFLPFLSSNSSHPKFCSSLYCRSLLFFFSPLPLTHSLTHLLKNKSGLGRWFIIRRLEETKGVFRVD